MSPEERARAMWSVVEESHTRRSGTTYTTHRVVDPFGAIVVSSSDRAQAEAFADDDARERGAPIARAIAEAVAAEREACAQLVDANGHATIADRIRARGQR